MEAEEGSMSTTCWKEELAEAMKERGETLADIESSTLTQEQLVHRFYPGYGSVEGTPFTVWTAKSIYFPGCYDGKEWVASVSRHPDGVPTEHIGG